MFFSPKAWNPLTRIFHSNQKWSTHGQNLYSATVGSVNSATTHLSSCLLLVSGFRMCSGPACWCYFQWEQRFAHLSPSQVKVQLGYLKGGGVNCDERANKPTIIIKLSPEVNKKICSLLLQGFQKGISGVSEKGCRTPRTVMKLHPCWGILAQKDWLVNSVCDSLPLVNGIPDSES